MTVYEVGYAVGTVLCGFLVAVPMLFFGRLLHRLTRGRSGNPWWFPLLSTTLILLLAVVAWQGRRSSPQDPVIGLGFAPAWCWSLGGLRRDTRKRDPLED